MKPRSDYIMITILAIIVIGFLGVRYLNEKGYTDISLNPIDWIMQGKEYKTYQLGTAKRAGSVGVEIHYDVTPVDVILIAPDGSEYSEHNHDVTVTQDDELKTTTVLVDTDKLGDWFVKFNQGRNHQISYKFLNKASGTLYLQDVGVYEESGNHYIAFTPVMGEPTMTSQIISTTLMLNNYYKSYILFSDMSYVNTENTIIIDIPESAYEFDEYTLLLGISYTNPEGEMQSAKYTMTIHLQK